jgi:DNA polymerase-3 subunit beta
LEKGQLQLTANDQEGGEADDCLTVDYEGAQVAIGFNVQFLSDFFNAVEEDEVSFSFKDATSQALISVDIGPQDCFKEVVMPLRI